MKLVMQHKTKYQKTQVSRVLDVDKFTLFLYKSSSTNIEELSNSYRERSEVYYTRNLGSAGNIRYDVTAPFFNLIDIKATYSRFSKTILV